MRLLWHRHRARAGGNRTSRRQAFTDRRRTEDRLADTLGDLLRRRTRSARMMHMHQPSLDPVALACACTTLRKAGGRSGASTTRRWPAAGMKREPAGDPARTGRQRAAAAQPPGRPDGHGPHLACTARWSRCSDRAGSRSTAAPTGRTASPASRRPACARSDDAAAAWEDAQTRFVTAFGGGRVARSVGASESTSSRSLAPSNRTHDGANG